MTEIKKPWFVYLLRCSDNSLYTGITTDINRRLNEHNKTNRGAKYTRARRPVTLVYIEEVLNKSIASKREYQIKKQPKLNKERLVHIFSLKNVFNRGKYDCKNIK